MENLVSSAFWSERRVFLTGHTGFKGAWLSLLLSGWGAKVHGFALAPIERGIYETARIEDVLAESTSGDIRVFNDLAAALSRSEAEIVFHLAAQPLVRLSYETPVETYATNVMGTVHLLEAVRRTPSVRAVVIVTTDKCYENREWDWGYRENEPMGGHDPYSSSKGCCELVTSAYRRSFFGSSQVGIASGRAGNVVGGGDVSRDRLVPDLVHGLRAGGTPVIRNPVAVRPWQHVLEPLSGYVLLAEKLCAEDAAQFADAWNFGPDPAGERSVENVADTVCRIWGGGAAWQLDTKPHVHEASFLKLDSSKAKNHLGWTPRWDFDRTLSETIAWYRAEASGEDMRSVTERQIADFLETPSHR